MKKTFSIIVLCLIMVSSIFALSGCGGKNYDGIVLSNVKYELTAMTGQQDRYKMTFSCKVKNSTNEDLQFNINYSARYGGVLGSITTKTELILLPAKQTRELTYVREGVGDQIYTKKITIDTVKSYEIINHT